MECLICKSRGRGIFSGRILHKYDVQYFQCEKCGLIYTESPYWIEEAYSDSITCVDTGIMSRNISYMLITNTIVDKFFDKNAKFLDYGGGYGIFTRMMRDLGYDWVWQDKFSPNLLAGGFEYRNNLSETIELATAFELFEHLDDPMKDIKYLTSISDSILFSTLIYDDDLCYKDFAEWWYYVPETGQHITFYSKKTLEYIAKQFDLKYYKINEGLHMFTKKDLRYTELNRLVNSKWAWARQIVKYRINGRRSLVSKDNEKMLKVYKVGKEKIYS